MLRPQFMLRSLPEALTCLRSGVRDAT